MQGLHTEPPWSDVKVGDTIEIVYELNNPENNTMVKSGFPPWADIVMGLFGLASLLFCATLTYTEVGKKLCS